MPDRRADRTEDFQFIPVSELLASHKLIRRLEPEPRISVDALLERERPQLPAQEPEPVVVSARSRRHAPLVLGAAAVVAVLCSALVATYLMGRHGDQDTPPPAAAPENITGAKVFQPDAIKASIVPGGNQGVDQDNHINGTETDQTADEYGTGEYEPASTVPGPGDPGDPTAPADQAAPVGPDAPAGPHAPAGPGAQVPAGSQSGAQAQGTPSGSAGVGAAPGQAPGAAAAPAPQAPASPPTVTTTTADPVISTIKAFYAALPSDPATAYAMLAPSVRDGTLEQFAASWMGVSSVVVQSVKPAGPNAAVVRVTLLRTDGTSLVTNQRIVVSTGPTPMIVDARLLSASLA